ncbi:predicted periplasmic protein [Sulfuricella denitrificans skB26]|uniref:Predicted periplasmic protein n=2 Tax=Sulfuricella denitrificans TaxID=649841 RepID=S6B0Q9_SULDS|nr:predicted periplasmic protein [Sulfuricella denitrificans skB26]
MLGTPIFMNAGELAPSDREITAIGQKYGQTAASRVQKWRGVLLSDPQADESRKLELVNRFFNTLPFVSDQEHWGKMDYWATPTEFLATNGGDCEDFAIAKYLTLREIGVPAERLRITYVKAMTLNQAHMVLTYYPTPDAEPLVLDNLQPDIKPASQRQDLIPVYSFNGDNLWLAKELTGRSQLVGESDRISLWKDLLKRMKLERETGR